ncbi:alpha/beta hydrolase-fold protein [Robiginitalea sp. M366]|uniref:esterase n=1 Tax=Robiginitalea aestuariiviva TaxID=3036903 RepID=UPI00240E91D9|nr:esterase [Robiginitalea aestuariiviva]MDG1571932.1 alpha/beta hydrolase-fold protein [Robiginitalea aestuariiviva]
MKILSCVFFIAIFPWLAGAQELAQNAPVVSPELVEENTVIFRIQAPDANSVKLSGNWMPNAPDGNGGFAQEMVPLTLGENGVWSATIQAMEPELYAYAFMVDGVRTLDPANKNIVRDGRFSTASVLYVPGPASDLYWAKAGPKGSVEAVWYESPTLGLTRRMFVYTPPGYKDSNADYPVLYLLHGGGGDEEAWPSLGAAANILDNLINAGQAQPMLVVMTNGNPDQAAAFTVSPKLDRVSQGAGGMANMMFEKSLVNDVIPYVEAHYQVKRGKENRALTGLSMGGLQTMNTTFENPGLFDYIGVMSMGFADLSRFGIEVDHSKREQQIRDLKAAAPSLYWIACGKDDFLYESVVTMRSKLDELEFPYIYRESPGGHTWTNWRIYLSEFAPMLFK